MKNSRNNPWLGLRSYTENDHIYGRDKEIEELSQKIIYNAQTVIYGKSGIGKSSLLNAGVFPVLRRHNFFPVYVRLLHDGDRADYALQLATAVKSALSKLKIEDLGADEGERIRPVKGYLKVVVPAADPAHEGMWEFFHRHHFCYRDSEGMEQQVVPVLVFDQFEEIFTLQKSERAMRLFFEEFASLLNNICPEELMRRSEPTEEALCRTESTVEQPTKSESLHSSLIKTDAVRIARRRDYIDEANFHVVISLREDFLSHLERNIQYIPSLKHNRYCLLPLTEDQASEIIRNPIPGLVSEEVARRIIRKVTRAENPDNAECSSGEPDAVTDNQPEAEISSAILSLFLSELYKRKDPDQEEITQEHVELFGKDIIPDYYEQTISNELLSEESLRFLEKNLVTAEGRREGIYFEVAYANGVTPIEINYLIGQRLMQSYRWRGAQRLEFSHDVLCPIVLRRREEEERRQEQQRQREVQQRQREALVRAQRTRRRYLITLIAIWPLLFALALGLLFAYGYEHKVRYRAVVRKHSWLTGLERISKEEASHLPYHYLFYYKGFMAKHPFRVEARDGYDRLTDRHNLKSFPEEHFDVNYLSVDEEGLAYTHFNTVELRGAVRWELEAEPNSKFCRQETAYNERGTAIYAYRHIRSHTHNNQYTTYLTDRQGLPFPLVLEGGDRSKPKSAYMYTEMDSLGYEAKLEFKDVDRNPLCNLYGSFITRATYDAAGHKLSDRSHFLNDRPMIDKAGNCGWEVLLRDPVSQDRAVVMNLDMEDYPCRVKEQGSVWIREYDAYGRMVKVSFWDCDHTRPLEEYRRLIERDRKAFKDAIWPVENEYGIHAIRYAYDDRGNVIREELLDAAGEPLKACEKYRVFTESAYDDQGNLTYAAFGHQQGRVDTFYEASYDEGCCLYKRSGEILIEGDTLYHQNEWWDEERGRMVKLVRENDRLYYYTECDKQGNPLLEALYQDAYRQIPVENEQRQHYCTWEYHYEEVDHRNDAVVRFYSRDHHPAGRYVRVEISIDSLKRQKSFYLYTTELAAQYGVDSTENPRLVFVHGVREFFEGERMFLMKASVRIDQRGRQLRDDDNSYMRNYVSPIPSTYSSKHMLRDNHLLQHDLHTYYLNPKPRYPPFFEMVLRRLTQGRYVGCTPRSYYLTNEFGEHALAVDRQKGKPYYHVALLTENRSGDMLPERPLGDYYDEDARIISSLNYAEPRCFVMVEQNDNIGLCHGDILLQQNDWHLTAPFASPAEAEQGVARLEQDIASNRECHFMLLRYSEQRGDYEVVQVRRTLASSPEHRRIGYRLFYATQREVERIMAHAEQLAQEEVQAE